MRLIKHYDVSIKYCYPIYKRADYVINHMHVGYQYQIG